MYVSCIYYVHEQFRLSTFILWIGGVYVDWGLEKCKGHLTGRLNHIRLFILLLNQNPFINYCTCIYQIFTLKNEKWCVLGKIELWRRLIWSYFTNDSNNLFERIAHCMHLVFFLELNWVTCELWPRARWQKNCHCMIACPESWWSLLEDLHRQLVYLLLWQTISVSPSLTLYTLSLSSLKPNPSSYTFPNSLKPKKTF